MSAAPLVSVVIPCFRDGARAVQAAQAMRRQKMPPGDTLQIVIVDDGSGDGTAARLQAECGEHARILALPLNIGRAAARNAGAREAPGNCLLFLDCDCRPHGDEFLLAHLTTLATGAVASAGPVDGTGRGFWHRYQQAASARRAAHAQADRVFAGSTQNLMVRRDAFEAVGGFDEGYRGYGFEDRDLLLRLATHGALAWTPSACVSHLDELRLAGVCDKMRQAGGENAARFAARHPHAYAQLGYAAIDVQYRAALRLAARWLAPLLPVAIATVQRLLETPLLPFAVRAALVRALSGASFLCGTHEREAQRRAMSPPSNAA